MNPIQLTPTELATAAQQAMMNGAPTGPQQIQIPGDTPCVWNLNIMEAAGILDVLEQAPLPQRKWGALLMRLQSMTQQAAQDSQRPKTAPQEALLAQEAQTLALEREMSGVTGVMRGEMRGGALVDEPKKVRAFDAVTFGDAKAALFAAEQLRRTGDGTLNVVPPTEDPNQDYSAPLTLIGLALHHLEESLPNGQLERTQHALSALNWGATQLSRWLAERTPPTPV